ncbi:MAG: hypothetical protein M1608_05205 [Candidatus Omnitrophica bacterium]|nr:hypothetical protein [Candidatus Omnitrophota bacterium]
MEYNPFKAMVKSRKALPFVLALVSCYLTATAAGDTASSDADIVSLAQLVGKPVDVASSAYLFRSDRTADQNPPETWFLLVQYAGLPYDKPIPPDSAVLNSVLCGLLWEEVRPVDRLELSWADTTKPIPSADQLVVTYFDSTDGNGHTWFNPRTKKEAGKPEVAAGGKTYAYAIPEHTWGIVVSLRDNKTADGFAVPTIRALVPEVWKRMNLVIEWGFGEATEALNYDGHLETYDAVLGQTRPLAGDSGMAMIGPADWKSRKAGDARRGIQTTVLYIGAYAPRKVWPQHCSLADTYRSLITVRTQSGSFTFNVSDLENGPILAPEFGFYVANAQSGQTAEQFRQELAAKGLKTISERVRLEPEQTWKNAVQAMWLDRTLPPIPKPDFKPRMQIDVPSKELVDQWNLGAWHILRRAQQDINGHWRFNDYPFGVLGEETYLILRALDLIGMHKEAADGLDQWLELTLERPKPLGLFSDGYGCFTHAKDYIGGVGGTMDGVHCMGPGAIAWTMTEHYWLTGDEAWLKAAAPRMKANAEWILRQRNLWKTVIPNGDRLWCKGLQPAHVVTPDSANMHMQFYESEAYYWLSVEQLGETLAQIDPAGGATLLADAEAYRKDLLAAVDRSITLSPVIRVRDGTYRSFIPFAPYVRGCASGAWGWRRCGNPSNNHVTGLYWDTVQSAAHLISPAQVLTTKDKRVQGFLDVLEDRLLVENDRLEVRTPHYDPDKDWFAHAGWQYQCGYEKQANIQLDADDPPNFIRSMLNQYAADIQPGEYTFREHTVTGPPDKSFEEAAFLERFRMALVMEDGQDLWLARATPRAWLEQDKRIAVRNAATHFGLVTYEIVSDTAHGRITANIQMPERRPPQIVLLRFRHPAAAPIKSVTVNGKQWLDFDPIKEVIRLHDVKETVRLEARY